MIRIWTILALGCLALWACNDTKKVTSKIAKSIVIDIKVKDTSKTTLDTLRLYAWKNIQAEEVLKQAVVKTTEGFTCKFEMGQMPRGMYYIGSSLRDLRPLLLGTENALILEGNSDKMSALTIVASDLNKDYEKMMESIQVRNQTFMTLMTDYAALKDDQTAQESVKKKMAEEDAAKIKTLDSLRKMNSELARIMAFNAFQSYQNNGESGQVEGSYFAESFFEHIDFTDTVYANLPFYYENIKNYATALTQVGLKADQQQAALDSLLAEVPDSHQLYKPTLVGAMFGMMGRNNQVFLKYGKMYLDKYKGDYEMLDKFVGEQVTKLKGAAGVGEVASNIKGQTPEGKMLELANLKGKYVLIDFWASWCGPCRRENPHVVKLYKKYKDQGFDILGVSLDNNKQKWVDAIAKDGLTWHHVSDLKGWGSELSKPYGVRGIPYTVLVDKEGKIIAKRLRGPALEAKLKEIFGS